MASAGRFWLLSPNHTLNSHLRQHNINPPLNTVLILPSSDGVEQNQIVQPKCRRGLATAPKHVHQECSASWVSLWTPMLHPTPLVPKTKIFEPCECFGSLSRSRCPQTLPLQSGTKNYNILGLLAYNKAAESTRLVLHPHTHTCSSANAPELPLKSIFCGTAAEIQSWKIYLH